MATEIAIDRNGLRCFVRSKTIFIYYFRRHGNKGISASVVQYKGAFSLFLVDILKKINAFCVPSNEYGDNRLTRILLLAPPPPSLRRFNKKVFCFSLGSIDIILGSGYLADFLSRGRRSTLALQICLILWMRSNNCVATLAYVQDINCVSIFTLETGAFSV